MLYKKIWPLPTIGYLWSSSICIISQGIAKQLKCCLRDNKYMPQTNTWMFKVHGWYISFSFFKIYWISIFNLHNFNYKKRQRHVYITISTSFKELRRVGIRNTTYLHVENGRVTNEMAYNIVVLDFPQYVRTLQTFSKCEFEDFFLKSDRHNFSDIYTECKKKRTLCLGTDYGGIYWRKFKK